MMMKSEERRVAAVLFTKVIVLLGLSGIWVGKEREVAFKQNMEVAAPLDVVEKNVGCIYVNWSASG